LLPSHAAAEKDGRAGYKLGLQMPCYYPVLRYANDRALRQTLYRANMTRASEFGPEAQDNSETLVRILALRHELALLLGFASFSDYSLATKMAETPQQVMAFLRDLATRSQQYARHDRNELESFARDQLQLEPLEAWDIAYVSEKLMEAHYSFSQEEVKAYFTETTVLAGLFAVIRSLYDVTVEADSAPAWNPDVRFYRLIDNQGACSVSFTWICMRAKASAAARGWTCVATVSAGRMPCRRRWCIWCAILVAARSASRQLSVMPK
jgi:Zn-dependent oligopeptidases